MVVVVVDRGGSGQLGPAPVPAAAGAQQHGGRPVRSARPSSWEPEGEAGVLGAGQGRAGPLPCQARRQGWGPRGWAPLSELAAEESGWRDGDGRRERDREKRTWKGNRPERPPGGGVGV